MIILTKTKRLALTAGLFLISLFITKAQNPFYALSTIQKIEVHFSAVNWDYHMDTAKIGADDYVLAEWVKINGLQFDSVGVKYKGNSSYDSTYIKNPLHIELDFVNDQAYNGVTDIKLGNGYADPSVIREVLSYNILQQYMDCPESNFAQLYINGNYLGLYSNVESINKDFCAAHYFSSYNTFFKCNPVVTPGPTTKSNLRYIPLADSSGYFNFYELKSKDGWNDLVRLCDSVTNTPASIINNIDMDRAMWMLAYNNVLVNLDSYSGLFCQNYYIYKDQTNRYVPTIWDLNMCLGGFPFAGSGATGFGSLTVTNMQQLSPTLHGSDIYWPLIKDVMSDASLKRQYIAHARTINNENFISGNYITTATQLQSLVDTAVQSDSNAFFTYTQFQNGLTANQAVGSYTVPGISNLMSARSSYLQSTAEFTLVPPSISNVLPSDSTPNIFDIVNITALATNATAVWLGYRQNQPDRFNRVLMYDDGLHNDGVAGDQVYGISITDSGVTVQYYIYAENTNAGMFSPERAEHEFYELKTQLNTASIGQVVINELLASNNNDATNEYGKHADWIELFNTTNAPLSMGGLYLTDDFTNYTKFIFPVSAIIQPHGYLMLWADQQTTTSTYLHCNFKLSAGGEGLLLSDGTAVIDSINFGIQTADVSYGRCPNGTGGFIYISPATFGIVNCNQSSLSEVESEQEILLYPNPSGTETNYQTLSSKSIQQIEVLNSLGQVMKTLKPSIDQKIDIELQPGLYQVVFFFADGNRKSLKWMKMF